MVDDLDERSLDIMLENGLMPNLKRHVVEKSVKFSEAFTSYPLCCPSRATFLTGQYPHNHGVWSNMLPDGGVSKLDDRSTLATWLKKSGYYTSYVGKYLNEYGEDTPQTYVPPGWMDWQATVDDFTYLMYSYIINDNGKIVQYGSQESDYQTDVLAARSVQFIAEREAKDWQPFFLYVNPLAPHTEDSTPECKLNYASLTSTLPPERYIGTAEGIELPKPPSFNEADVSDKPSKVRFPLLTDSHIQCLNDLFHARLETMRAVDDLVGRVVSSLQSGNELWKTVIVFTSDNGFFLGEHRLHGKVRSYEEAIGVPLYIRIPKVAPQVIDRLVINNDLAPTFLELAEAQAGSKIDGRSLVPLIENSDIGWRNGFLVETPKYSSIRTDNYVYIHHSSGAVEIYDLDKDPYQLQNAKGKSVWSSKITSLQNWRLALESCEGSTCKTAENMAAP
jgi:arylsulfatase A-like enzyme